ncbi:MAG: hypothetical protein ABIE43_01905 [Patescibacteria group bacterium]
MDKFKKFQSNLYIILFSVFFFLFSAATCYAQDNFNPNYIISDSEILDYTSMNITEVNDFLKLKNGYLSNYSTVDPNGKTMTAAEIIYDRAITNKISPKFLIVLLQKEQSLIEEKSPKQSQLDWATGYGCPDNASCNPRWKGFYKQVNSASLQFRDYIDNPHLYTYKMGETYTFANPYATIKNETTSVTPANSATAALYNYTPHVYNGNYNFYKIWQRYFTRSYYDGSLLQAEGEAGVWLIQNGKKRPFLTKGALTSRFDENKIITTSKADLDKYEKGAPIKFPNYSLVRSPRGTIFLLVDDKRRGFADGEAFRKIGYNPEEVMDASWEDINAYQEGQALTATSTYPTGALLQNNKTGGVYWVNEGTKAPILDAIFLKTKFKNKKIIAVSPEELEDYATVNSVLFDDGELLKTANSPAVYLISNKEKRLFVSGKLFEKFGYKWDNIITVSPKVLYLYKAGELITYVTNSESEE